MRLKSMFVVLAGGLILVTAGACGSQRATSVQATPPTTTAAPTAGLKAVRYRSVTFDVPAAWPVYDLAADQKRCARFDLHAVYLGHQGANANCPARALGKSDAVQIEPDDQSSQARALPSPSTTVVNGEPVALEPGSQASHNLVATYPGLGVVVTASFGQDQAQAQRIVSSVRKAGG